MREKFNHANALDNNGRKGTVSFTLATLQRLAPSPETIYQSFRRLPTQQTPKEP